MIDIHIHHLALDQTQKTFSVYNQMLHENMQLEECILFSAGFHPWYINEDMDEEEMFRQLMNSAKQPNCIRIKEIVLQWIRHGSYLSFGKEICLSSHPAVQALKSIPTTHLLLETDESTIPITTIYQYAANLLSVSEEALEEIISSNIRKIIPAYEQYMDATNSHFDR